MPDALSLVAPRPQKFRSVKKPVSPKDFPSLQNETHPVTDDRHN